MANLSTVVKHLRNERDRAARELERLDNAITALDRIAGRGNGRRGTTGGPARRQQRKMSAAGRRRIAAAQKARWAKIKQRKAARGRRTVSAAARNRIATAQRARWAKLKTGRTQKAAARTANKLQKAPARPDKKPVQKVQASAA